MAKKQTFTDKVGKDNKKCLLLFNFDKSKQKDLDKMTEAIYKFIDD